MSVRSLTSADRALIVHIHSLWTKGFDTFDMASRLGVPESTIANTIGRWRDDGPYQKRAADAPRWRGGPQ